MVIRLLDLSFSETLLVLVARLGLCFRLARN
jgi:hypothetical protein